MSESGKGFLASPWFEACILQFVNVGDDYLGSIFKHEYHLRKECPHWDSHMSVCRT
jgi:hypothetical protein